jgi:hypothetical protein
VTVVSSFKVSDPELSSASNTLVRVTVTSSDGVFYNSTEIGSDVKPTVTSISLTEISIYERESPVAS